MCMQCVSEAKKVCDLFGPYCLMQAKKTVCHQGYTWYEGQYAVVWFDDPEFVFQATPIPNIYDDDDESAEACEYFDRFIEVVAAAEEEANKMGTLRSYDFVRSCMEAGYDREVHGSRIMCWVVDFVARKLDSSPK